MERGFKRLQSVLIEIMLPDQAATQLRWAPGKPNYQDEEYLTKKTYTEKLPTESECIYI